MITQKICGLILIFLGLGNIFFAKRIFDFFAELPGGKAFVQGWPAWMFPAWIWGMRIVGIMGFMGGLSLIFSK
jgi:hypothetical protein